MGKYHYIAFILAGVLFLGNWLTVNADADRTSQQEERQEQVDIPLLTTPHEETSEASLLYSCGVELCSVEVVEEKEAAACEGEECEEEAAIQAGSAPVPPAAEFAIQFAEKSKYCSLLDRDLFVAASGVPD